VDPCGYARGDLRGSSPRWGLRGRARGNRTHLRSGARASPHGIPAKRPEVASAGIHAREEAQAPGVSTQGHARSEAAPDIRSGVRRGRSEPRGGRQRQLAPRGGAVRRRKPSQASRVMSDFRCGTVAFAGRPNAGKSSLLNALLGEKLAIVSAKAQTTRHLLTGMLTKDDCQYLLVDLPGYQTRHPGPLNRALNRRAVEGARDCDLVVFVVEALRYASEDRTVLARIPREARIVVAVNKIDLVRDRSELLPFLQRLSQEREFAALVPVSARSGENLSELLRVLREGLPQGSAAYPVDQLTDRNERFFAAEILREKLFRRLGEEL